MSLPVKFGGVHYYRIADHYIFAGDLFIARGMLYFFPEVDLAEQRHEISEYLPHQLALFALVVVFLTQNLKSYSSRNQLVDQGDSDEHFETKARAYIAQLKEERSQRDFGETLPLPTCVSASEVSNLKLGLTGKISFAAQSDNHDFNIGLRRKKLLRDALWEAGFLKL